MGSPAAGFPTNAMPGEPVNGPVAVSGRPQPTVRGPRIKTVQVKAHTRQVKVNPKLSRPQPQQTQTQQPFDPAIQAAVDLRFQPQIQANQQQVRNAQFGQIRAQHWYDDYQNMLAANQKAVAGQAQALAQTLGAYNPPAAQTGNAQADALAQQAQQSQKYLGQSFAGTQGQLTQNVANEFATGLMPGAALRAGDVQQGLTNQIGQLQQQGGQLKAQAGEYGTGLKAQADAAAQKEADTQAGIKIKQDTLDYLSGNARSEARNRVAGQKVARAKVRLNYAQLKEKTAADQAASQAKSDAAAARNSGSALKRTEFIAKYGLPPERVDKMTPGQLSNFAKKNPQFTGFRPPKTPKNGPAAFTNTQVRTGQKSFRKALNTIKTYGLGPADAGTLDAFGVTDPLLGKVAMLWAHHQKVDGGTLRRFVNQYGFDPNKGF